MSQNHRPLLDTIQRWGYAPIMLMQSAVDIPTWLGAYHKALHEGTTEDEAIAQADRSVIDSQGSGSLKDLSGIEAGGPWTKLLTVFYTFFNTALNILMVAKSTKGIGGLAYQFALVVALQATAETFLRAALKAAAKGEEPDDEWWKKNARQAFGNVVGFNAGMFVLARELQDPIASFVAGETAQAYRGPSGLRKIGNLGKLLTQIGQGELDDQLVKAAATVVGEWTGMPVVPVTRAMSAAKASREGKVSGIGQTAAAYMFGYTDY